MLDFCFVLTGLSYLLEIKNMRIRDSYIMREQVDNLIPTIMKQSVTNQNRQSEKLMSAISVTVVTFIYLLAMAFSAD